jgi:nitrogen regulatory protein PII
MSNNTQSTDYSLLSLILPKGTASPVVEAIVKAGASGIFEMTARGSVLSEGGFLKNMFPPPSPEQHLLQTLVPNSKVDAVTEAAVDAGNLHQGGSGAVFEINCGEYSESDGFPGAEKVDGANGRDASGAYAADLVAICCICEIGGAEDIAKAALQSGAPGPTITFGEGGGLRDKIPVLRMTKGPEKEFVWCVVEKAEADSVFAEMARAGRITEPGRGFMYTIPVNAGIVHVSSVVSTASQLASMDQVIAAMDEIKGGKEWRVSAGIDAEKGKALQTNFLKNLVGLYCIVPRDNYSDIYDTILEAGAPGVSTNFGVMLDADAGEGEQAQNEEWAVVYTSLGPANVDKVRNAMVKKLDAQGIVRSAFYTLPIPRALTYLG